VRAIARRRADRPRGPGTAAARLVVFACAASAGAHAGLVPEHLREEPALGVAVLVAAVLLLAAAAALSIRPTSAGVARAAALLLAGLILAYAASRTTGLPVLQSEPEGVDPVGVGTNLVEAVGLVLAIWLSQPVGGRRSPTVQEVTR
jgi:peptidoglycan/LPS O-acetylase OafA/YrhL